MDLRFVSALHHYFFCFYFRVLIVTFDVSRVARADRPSQEHQKIAEETHNTSASSLTTDDDDDHHHHDHHHNHHHDGKDLQEFRAQHNQV